MVKPSPDDFCFDVVITSTSHLLLGCVSEDCHTPADTDGPLLLGQLTSLLMSTWWMEAATGHCTARYLQVRVVVCDVTIRFGVRRRHRLAVFRFCTLREYGLLSTISSCWYHLLVPIWYINRTYSRSARTVSAISSTAMWTPTCPWIARMFYKIRSVQVLIMQPRSPDSFLESSQMKLTTVEIGIHSQCAREHMYVSQRLLLVGQKLFTHKICCLVLFSNYFTPEGQCKTVSRNYQ